MKTNNLQTETRRPTPMKKNLVTAILYTIVTTILLGIIYPLSITGVARLINRDKAQGQLIMRNGTLIGSRIIAQPFTGPAYFHPRPSAAGANGYDAGASGASNLGPTNQKLVDRVADAVKTLQSENPGTPVPIDLVTTSGSGLDPHITPAAAEFQLPRIARTRGVSEAALMELVRRHTEARQWRIFGEPRINVLELNLHLDQRYPLNKQARPPVHSDRNAISGSTLVARRAGM